MLYNQPHDFPLPEFKILTTNFLLVSITLSMILLSHSYHMCRNLVSAITVLYSWTKICFHLASDIAYHCFMFEVVKGCATRKTNT